VQVLLSHTAKLLAICAAGTSTTRETDSITGEIQYTLNKNHEKNWRKRQIFQNDNNNLPILIKYSHFEKMWKNPSFSPNFPMIVQAAHLRRVVRSGSSYFCASICHDALPTHVKSNGHISMPNLITNFLIEKYLFPEFDGHFGQKYCKTKLMLLICPLKSFTRLGSASWHRYSRAISPTSFVDPCSQPASQWGPASVQGKLQYNEQLWSW